MSRWFREGSAVHGIPVDARALQYGDGLFETIAIRDGQPRLWDYHVERLQSGCARLGLEAPGHAMLEEALHAALDGCDTDVARCTAKIIVGAAPGPRGYRRSSATCDVPLVGVFDSPPLALACYRDGVTARLCNTRLAVQPQLAGIKTLNRLEQVLARAEWQDPAIFEGLTLDTAGRLICGTMSNVFLVNGQALVTPAITRCGVSGVMRRCLLALLADAGIACEVRDVTLEELRGCDSLFLTNSQFGALPVTAFGRRHLVSGALFATVRQLLADHGIREGLG